VIARTPGGAAADSTTATFQPLPAQLIPVGGAGQSGTVGFPLQMPLEVEVRAADNLPVGGVSVRFRSLSGGAPADSTVLSDANGRARVVARLGPTAGVQSFRASLPAFPGVTAVTFGATALAGLISAATSLMTVATGSVTSGSGVVLTLRGKDASGNDVTGGGATVVFSATGGTSTGSIGATSDNGDGTYTATFTGMLAGTVTTIGATINGQAVTTPLPTISVLPGPISAATSLVIVGNGTVISGASTLLTLQGKDAAGNPVTSAGASVMFTASGGAGTSTGIIGATTDHGNGTYSATFTGVTVGTGTTIGALIDDVAVSSTPLPSITVVAGAIDSVAVTPPSATLDALSAAQPFAAQAFDVSGNPVSGATFTWATTDTLVASVDNAGLATALANGTVTISATADGVTGAASLTVAQAMASVTVSPQSATLHSLNDTEQLTAHAVDRLGNSLVPQPTFTWSATNTLVARVNQGGLATSLANGLTRIVAMSGGVADTADLTVQQVVASVVVTPDPVLLTAAGETVQLTAEARDSGGSAVSGATFMWSSSNPLAGTVDATGLVTAAANGTTDISAAMAGVQGVARVTVNLLGAATRLVFVKQPPSPVFFDEPFTVHVAAQDDSGNTVTGFSGNVVLSENVGSRNLLSKLQGTLTRPAVAGVATFTDLSVDGTDTTAIDAIGDAVASATSNTFEVVNQIVLQEAGATPYFAGVDTVTNRIYVSNTSGRSATVLDGGTPKVAGTIGLGQNPGWEGVNPERKQVYISDFDEGAVYIVDESDERVVDIIPAGSTATQPVANSKGDTIYVPAQRDGLSLVIVDMVERKIAAVVPIGGASDRAGGAVWDPTTGLVWVVIETQGVIKSVDPERLQIMDVITVGESPYGIAIDPRLNRLYVTLSLQNQVAVIDLTDKRSLQPIAVGQFPQGLSVDVESGRVFVANAGDRQKPGTVTVIDGIEGVVIATITVGAGPGDAEYNPRNRLLYVPNRTDNSISIVKPN
jgi:DNA-binding beta-propeller fold protein YncE